MADKINVLLLGSGGREHALAWAIARSPILQNFYAYRGSDAIGEYAQIIDEDLDAHEKLVSWCKAQHIDLVIVGAEQPLVDGVADALRLAGIAVFGPNQKAAQLEGSKIFMKEFLTRHNIPTAKFASFTEPQAAKNYIDAEQKLPIIIKTDGLAAGKGVIVAQTKVEALQAVDELMAGKFGAAGQKLIIEEFMAGDEISWFAIADGTRAQFFGSAQDYKRACDGGLGLNTGGMGAFSPARQENDALNNHIDATILQPLMAALAKEGLTYCGILFFGIMLVDDGGGKIIPKVIEINIRLGDPETQVLLPRLQDDLLTLFYHAALGNLRGALPDSQINFKSTPALTVVYAANGYPSDYQKGSEIKNLDVLKTLPEIHVFHAGTKCQKSEILSNGGRVLNITAMGNTVADARAKAYDAIEQIDWQDGFYRRDIGL